MADGEFDNLPGRGKPLNLDAYFATPEDMRISYSVLKNAGVIPEQAELLKEIESLRLDLEQSVDENERIRIKRSIEAKVLKMNMMAEHYKRGRSKLLCRYPVHVISSMKCAVIRESPLFEKSIKLSSDCARGAQPTGWAGRRNNHTTDRKSRPRYRRLSIPFTIRVARLCRTRTRRRRAPSSACVCCGPSALRKARRRGGSRRCRSRRSSWEAPCRT